VSRESPRRRTPNLMMVLKKSFAMSQAPCAERRIHGLGSCSTSEREICRSFSTPSNNLGGISDPCCSLLIGRQKTLQRLVGNEFATCGESIGVAPRLVHMHAKPAQEPVRPRYHIEPDEHSS
jgi:hypothetical protein